MPRKQTRKLRTPAILCQIGDVRCTKRLSGWLWNVRRNDQRVRHDRIARDRRHNNPKILRLANTPARLFGEWSMGFAARTAKTERLFGLHWCNKGMNPSSGVDPV